MLEPFSLMKSPLVEPYLFFNGRCEEALTFYQQAIGARVDMLLRFNQSPDPVPEGLLAPGFEDKVMHASLMIGENRVMASDGCNPTGSFASFALSLALPDESAAQAAFAALADGGSIDMPLGRTFWSPCYGMLTDRFGVSWMVTVPDPNQP